MAIETGSEVTLEYVGRLPDGEVFDTSREEIAEAEGLKDEAAQRAWDPLTVEVGSGTIIEGLDEALVGMEAGDTDTVTIPPEKGYGGRNEEQVMSFPREQVEQGAQGVDLEEGMHLETQDGGVGTITDVGDEEIEVDFNHELAGETLEFEVEIVDVN